MVVKVTKALCHELTQNIDSGEVDMQNSRAVLEYAEKHGLMLAARAVRGNPRRYLECVNDGMETTESG